MTATTSVLAIAGVGQKGQNPSWIFIVIIIALIVVAAIAYVARRR